jgi:hypothetical protein
MVNVHQRHKGVQQELDQGHAQISVSGAESVHWAGNVVGQALQMGQNLAGKVALTADGGVIVGAGRSCHLPEKINPILVLRSSQRLAKQLQSVCQEIMSG